MLTRDLVVEGRRRADLTQAELADRLRKPQSTVARWETDAQRPSLETLRQVLNACGLDLDVRIVKYDDSYDSLCEAQLRLESAQRVRALLTAPFRPEKFAKALAREHVAYVLIGSLAGALRGSPIAPGDHRYLIVPATDPVNEARLAKALERLGATGPTTEDTYKGLHDVAVWTVADTLGELGVVREPAGTLGFRDLRRDASPIELAGGVEVLAASLIDLVRIAEASPWKFDQAQVPALRATLECVRRMHSRTTAGARR